MSVLTICKRREDSYRRGRQVKADTLTGVIHAPSQECLEPPEAGRGKEEFGLSGSRGAQQYSNLDFRILFSRTAKE